MTAVEGLMAGIWILVGDRDVPRYRYLEGDWNIQEVPDQILPPFKEVANTVEVPNFVEGSGISTNDFGNLNKKQQITGQKNNKPGVILDNFVNASRNEGKIDEELIKNEKKNKKEENDRKFTYEDEYELMNEYIRIEEQKEQELIEEESEIVNTQAVENKEAHKYYEFNKEEGQEKKKGQESVDVKAKQEKDEQDKQEKDGDEQEEQEKEGDEQEEEEEIKNENEELRGEFIEAVLLSKEADRNEAKDNINHDDDINIKESASTLLQFNPVIIDNKGIQVDELKKILG